MDDGDLRIINAVRRDGKVEHKRVNPVPLAKTVIVTVMWADEKSSTLRLSGERLMINFNVDIAGTMDVLEMRQMEMELVPTAPEVKGVLEVTGLGEVSELPAVSLEGVDDASA